MGLDLSFQGSHPANCRLKVSEVGLNLQDLSFGLYWSLHPSQPSLSPPRFCCCYLWRDNDGCGDRWRELNTTGDMHEVYAVGQNCTGTLNRALDAQQKACRKTEFCFNMLHRPCRHILTKPVLMGFDMSPPNGYVDLYAHTHGCYHAQPDLDFPTQNLDALPHHSGNHPSLEVL